MDVLEIRLKQRAQDNVEVIKKRMLAAKNEIAHYAEFDYLVVNDDFKVALKDLQVIIHAEHLRLERQNRNLLELIRKLSL